MERKILNHKTGRMVNASGVIGKQILSNRRKIVNPETGRMVNASGVIGKQISRNRRNMSPTKTTALQSLDDRRAVLEKQIHMNKVEALKNKRDGLTQKALTRLRMNKSIQKNIETVDGQIRQLKSLSFSPCKRGTNT